MYQTVNKQSIRSVACNLSDLYTLLVRSKSSFDLIVLTECWLRSVIYVPEVSDRNHVSTTKHSTQSEGVGTYYKKNMKLLT